ncbi:MAG: hypothetical protein K6D54_00040 [Bacteroidales bacterium]|nr:hypothetical protein [Bacteroidales bacterium]
MKDIEQFLRENKPQAPAEGQFLIETNARLGAVEGIRKTVSDERRRGRVALVVALVAGLVLCGLAMVAAQYFPVPDPAKGWPWIAKVLEAIRQWKEVLLALFAGCALALGVVFVTRRQEAL